VALAAVGGSAAAYGSVLTWVRVTARRAVVDINGTELFANLTVTGGLVALAAGLLMLAASSPRARALLAALTIVGGLTAAGIAIYVTASEEGVRSRLAEDATRRRGVNFGLAGRRAPDVTPRFGVILVAAGGALAAAGGTAGLFGARNRASTAAAAARVLDAAPDGAQNTPTPPADDSEED
jgi:hypothetical protein